PIARSVAAFLEYWQRWAQLWEFQALLRARFVAGDEHLGRRFESLAADFAYPASLSIDHLAEIRRMRVRIEKERVKPADAGRFAFKLGYGSLADVQFALALSDAYVFLTDVKNALEVDRRIHAEVVPPSPEEQVALARRLGYEEYPRQSFLEDYRRISRRARLAMERVFYGEDAG